MIIKSPDSVWRHGHEAHGMESDARRAVRGQSWGHSGLKAEDRDRRRRSQNQAPHVKARGNGRVDAYAKTVKMARNAKHRVNRAPARAGEDDAHDRRSDGRQRAGQGLVASELLDVGSARKNP